MNKTYAFAVITLVCLCAATRAAEMRGNLIGSLELKGLSVLKIALKDTKKVTATLGEHGCIIHVPPTPPPVEPIVPIDPPKPRSGCKTYTFELDLSDAVDAASYQLLLAARDRSGSCTYGGAGEPTTSYYPWHGSVNVSLDAKGHITELSLGGVCPGPGTGTVPATETK